MLNFFKKQITNVPEYINPLDRRIFIFSSLIYISGLLVHCILLAFFWLVDASLMSVYNVFSILCFAYCYYINHKGYLKAAFILMASEIAIHSALSVISIGWESGFQFFLFFIPPIIFINSTLTTKGKITFASLIIILFLSLYFYSSSYKPLYALDMEIQHIVYSASVLSTLLTFCFLGYFFSLAVTNAERNLENANKELSVLNFELQDKTDQILSSINYAKTLQSTILPNEKQLAKYFKEAYLIYIPKDYVSGDFYWVREIMNNRFIIAVADCTGHGVPGAMISMLGNLLLSEIIVQYGVIKPGEILDLLNTRIREILKQDEQDSFVNDGMDIAICDIDLNNKILRFSGAKRPLIHIRNKNITVLDATRHSIGGRRSVDVKFEEYESDLIEGDEIVMFSDGITDQNNSARKKFSTKLLSNSLLESNTKSNLLNKFYAFKGNEAQRDDVTLLSVKI